MENALSFKIPPACTTRRQSVLLIDDNPHRSDILAIWLEMASFNVSLAGSAADGLALARQEVFDLILIHSHLVGGAGAELCQQVRRVNHRTPVLLYSSEAASAVTRVDWSLPSEHDEQRLPVCA